MKMEGGLINSILNKIKRADEAVSPDENSSFSDNVNKAYENPNTLEYTKAIDKAKELMGTGLTSGDMIKGGEDAAAALCGSDIVDPAVVVGAMKKLEELEKFKTAE